MVKIVPSRKYGGLISVFLLIGLFTLVGSSISKAQISTVWEKSSASLNLPGWFGTDTERGLGAGTVGGLNRVYVVSRKGTTNVIVLNGATGDSTGLLNVTGVTGGLYTLNDVEVSDGVIYACNMTTSASTNAFKVYKWTSEAAAPEVIISWNTSAYRLGDKFTVVGSASDNSLTIYAAVSSNNKIIRFTTTDNGATFTATELTASGVSGSTPSVAPLGTGEAAYYVNANSISPKLYNSANVIQGTFPSEIVPTGSNAARYFSTGGKGYLATYLYGTTTNYARITDVSTGAYTATLLGNTPQLGALANTNGTGDIAVVSNGSGIFTLYVLASNNGLGAYTVNLNNLSTAVSPPFTFDFEGTVFPPLNITRFAGTLAAPTVISGNSTAWGQDDFGNVASPTNKSARLNIYGTSRKEWIITPPINLGDGTTDYQLEFDLALTTYNAVTPNTLGVDDKFSVIISTDNGVTWSSANTLQEWTSATTISNTGEHTIIDLSAYSGMVRIGFYGESTVSNADNDLFIDNVEVDVYVPQVTADWNNLQWPPTITVTEGSSETVYARIYKAGLTDITVGQAPGILAWIGISDTNTNPNTWTKWVPAAFNVEVGNDDEYMAAIGNDLPAGTYYYASRFQINYGPYTYGGYNGGFWNGTTNVSGVLTVNQLIVNNFPFSESFENSVFPPAGWSILDVNGGKTWDRSTSKPNTGSASARYAYHSTLPGDDWLFTPAVTLTSGKTYKITYYYVAQSATFPEKMNIYVGNAPTVAGMTTMLADHPNINSTIYQTNSVAYTAPSTGQYYIGFHDYSAADMYNLFLDDISVEEMVDNNYALTSLYQVNGIPSPFRPVVTGMEKGAEETQLVKNISGVPSSDVNNSAVILNPMNTFLTANSAYSGSIFGNSEAFGGSVTFKTHVTNLGTLSPTYQVKYWINGVAGTTIGPNPGLATFDTDTVEFTQAVTGRGTFTTTAAVVVTGDTLNANDTLNYYRTLVYPDSTIRLKYDNGTNTPNTFIGFGTSNTSLTGGVRFTAAHDMQLASIDAFYRNETSTDSVIVKIWAAGTDSLAPGAVLYTKKFGGLNYIVSGLGGDYLTLPLGDDAPVMMAGTDFWVSLTFDSLITYPLGVHNSPITTPGRSFYSDNDGATWVPLIVTTERAWLIRAVGIPYTPPPVITTWNRSAAGATLPAWFSTGNNERGIAFGKVFSASTRSLEERVFVVSRNGGLFVKMVDAITGADLGELNTTGITGGLFALNDVEVSSDGKVFACNMTTDANTSAFKVYMWDSLTAVPVNIISYTSPVLVRLGDKFTVKWSVADQTVQVWAASATAGQGKVYRWGMSSGAFNSVPEIITLSDNAAGGSASVGPLWGNSFYWNAGGQSARKYAADGTLIGVIPGTVIATGTNAIKFIGTVSGSEYIATYQYGAGNENARIVEVPGGDPTQAVSYGITTTLGSNSNTGGTGDVDVFVNTDGTADIYVLSTNNGIGAYVSSAQVPVELNSFAAMAEERNVILKWQTATETNTSLFQIERSQKNVWENVGTVRAAGTSTEIKEYSFIDQQLNSGKYQYRLKMIDLDGTYEYSEAVEVEVGIPAVFQLSQNYPNPFNPVTRVDYQIPADSRVTIELYDITGQKVAELFNNDQAAGYHSLDVQAGKFKLASGVYIYRMIAVEKATGKNFVNTKKMMLLK